MADGVLRILSDLHLGDRDCRVRRLPQLAPLFAGADALVLNGDSLDTRSAPAHLPAAVLAATNAANAARRAEFLDFLARHAPPGTLLTGNHDPDISTQHVLDLAHGRVFVTHGDVFFDDIMPWSREVAAIRAHLVREFAALAPAERAQLAPRLAVFRRVCGLVPQRRHHVECHPLRYAVGLLGDLAWPTRTFAVLRAWRETPARAARLMRVHRPQARFLVMGHTHHSGVVQAPGGLVIINTGSFCAPARPCAVDITAERLTVRRVVARRGAFHPGDALSTFTLAPAAASEKISA